MQYNLLSQCFDFFRYMIFFNNVKYFEIEFQQYGDDDLFSP